MTTAEIIQVWDRVGGESSRSFELFSHYRDEGLNRSLRKTAEAIGVSKRLLERMSATHSWQLRVRAFDREQDRQRQLDNRAAQREMVERHAALATLAQEKALERIRALSAETLSPTAALRLLDWGVKIERLSRGVPTEHVTSSEYDSVSDELVFGSEELASELRMLLLALEQVS
jgi:hypothetical protein